MQLFGFAWYTTSRLLTGLVAVEPVIALHGPRSVGKSTVLRFAGLSENLLEVLPADPEGVVGRIPSSTTTRPDYVERVCAGGLPWRCDGPARPEPDGSMTSSGHRSSGMLWNWAASGNDKP